MSDNQTIRVIPIGGFGQIGMNCLAIDFKGKILLIDCGVMFPSEPKRGIDVIHASFEYLVSRQKDIEAIFLTHGHEDHIAAIPYLLREINIPVYGAAYTLGLVKSRMSEFKHADMLVAITFEEGDIIELDSFFITPVSMPHSIVDNFGFLIAAGEQRIFHTSDFKLDLFDNTKAIVPKKIKENTEEKLKKMFNGNIDLMICDSTGIEENIISGEESNVADELADIIANQVGRVFVAIFSSNIDRITAIANVARKTRRKLSMAGRSVLNHYRVAVSVGRIKPLGDILVPIEEAQNYAPNRILIVVSGTQGENRSALGRLASENYKSLKIEKDDLIIFSSRFIPGNEIAISDTIDKLLQLGSKVIHNGSNSRIHVSGHGSKHEILAAIKAINPKAYLPAHGAYHHLLAAYKLATEAGVSSVALATNGQIVTLKNSTLSVGSDIVTTGKVMIDGGTSVSDVAMHDRSLLSSRGVMVVSFIANEQGFVTSEINVLFKGVLSEEVFDDIAKHVKKEILRLIDNMDDDVRFDILQCQEKIRTALRRFINKKISREPYVLVSIHKCQ